MSTPTPRLLAATVSALLLAGTITAGSAGPAVADDGPTVFESGTVTITPKLESATPEENTISGFRLGLLDDSSGTSETPWYAPQDAIIHLSDSSRDENGEFASGTEENPGLKVLVDLAVKHNGEEPPLGNYAFDQMNSRFGDDVVGAGQPNLRLANVSGPDTGVFRAMAGIREYWSSEALQAGEAQGRNVQVGVRRSVQLTFDQPGRYCLTFEELLPTNSHGTLSGRATYTVYAGELPAEPTTCEPADDWEAPAPTDATLFDSGHTDLRTGIRGGELVFGMGSNLLPISQAIWARTPPAAVTAAPTAGRDLTVLGEPGTEYWYYPAASTPEDFLWPGFSTESVAPGDILSDISITLNGYSIDGEPQPQGSRIVLQDGLEGAASPFRPHFDTTRGITSFDIAANIHAHPIWMFTQPGRYCINLSADVLTRAGVWKHDDALLTVAVGDEASAVAAHQATCEQQSPNVNDWPRIDATAADERSADAAHVEIGRGTGALLSFDNAGDDAELAILAGEGSRYASSSDPDHTVIVTNDRQSSGDYRVEEFELSTERALGGPVHVELGDVRGPGEVSFEGRQAHITRLSTASGVLSMERAVPSRSSTSEWRFTAAGVYCVPLTVTDANGLSAQATLTFAVGIADTSDIVACADGQVPGAVGTDPEPEPAEQPWNVDHQSLTASGAVILNDGHIDIASLIEDGSLVTRIKDTSVTNDPTWREPEDSVLQLLPDSHTTVPEAAAYGFLGAPGADLWAVEQQQRSGLLWPGWSTELIPVDATQAGITWTLDDATGPGSFALFQADSLGNPSVLFNTRDGVDSNDVMEIPKNTHAHGTWAFSAEGVYCLDFHRAATLQDGSEVSDSFRLTFAVGRADVRAIDPAACGESGVVDPGPGESGGSGEDGEGAGGAVPRPPADSAEGAHGSIADVAGAPGADRGSDSLALTGGQMLGGLLVFGGMLILAGALVQTLRRRGRTVPDGVSSPN